MKQEEILSQISSCFSVIVMFFLPVFHTLRQKIFNLSVDGTKIIFCPLGNFIIEAL